MQLFYTKSITKNDSVFVLDKEESKHVIKVLRKKENDTLFITNGLGCLFETKITLASDNKCTLEIINCTIFEKPKSNLHLAVAPTKMNERFEWFLEKATEIGVQEITPIICDNSERNKVNLERFEKIIIASMKQSNQYFLPKLNEAISFKSFINNNLDVQKFIAHCEEFEKKSLKTALQKHTNTIILIGPEGDFSEKEIQIALQNNYIPITLGSTRLRTETAAVVACHSFVFLNEN